MPINMDDYVEVPDRIREFIAKYPEGSIQCRSVEYRELPAAHLKGEPCLHIIYHAAAYRTPDDPRPGEGMASEPLPGLTPYTKGSELMNAETSAWGRALVALGFVSKKVASANEVRARQDTPEPTNGQQRTQRQPNGNIKASPAQLKTINGLITKHHAKPEHVVRILRASGFSPPDELGENWRDRLTGGREGSASALIGWLQTKPLPTGESDVPEPGPDEFAADPETLALAHEVFGEDTAP